VMQTAREIPGTAHPARDVFVRGRERSPLRERSAEASTGMPDWIGRDPTSRTSDPVVFDVELNIVGVQAKVTTRLYVFGLQAHRRPAVGVRPMLSVGLRQLLTNRRSKRTPRGED
jgi:hypothetical protein